MSSVSLYRKWRPQSFDDVAGQDHIKTTLINALKSSRISHAYLFTGPRGVGKTTIARIFAKAVNCKEIKNGEPCGKCSTCNDFSKGTSLDLIEIDGASNRGIDEIRELREKIKFTPHNSEYKVFIIDEVHMLTKEAFNALLKTLEEPPSHAIFILATTEIHKIPATVLSRCQKFNFSKIPLTKIIEMLEKITKEEKITAPPEAIRMIALSADGALRDAFSTLDQISSFGDKKITLELTESILGVADNKIINGIIKSLSKKDTKNGIQALNLALDHGVDINLLCDSLINKVRDILFAKVDNSLNIEKYSKEDLENLEKISKVFEQDTLVEILEKFNDIKPKLKYSFPSQLPLELAILEICGDQSNTKIPVSNSINAREKSEELSKSNELVSELKINQTVQKKEIKAKETSNRFDNNQDKAVIEENISSKTGDITIDEIKNNWQKILNELKSYNHSLTYILKSGTPEKIESNALLIGFAFAFHKDKIQGSLDNKRAVEDAIKKVTGKFVQIRCFSYSRGEKSKKIEPKKELPAKDEIADIFGGEVINE